MELLQQFFDRHKELVYLEVQVKQAIDVIVKAFRNGNKLLVCGNGGSSADADHIVGELMKGFEKKRPLHSSHQEILREQYGERGARLASALQQGLPAISLSAHSALITAVANDLGGEYIFAQQVAGFGKSGDVLWAISTSGNSANVIDALIVAKAAGLTTIGMTGETGGEVETYCDVLLNVTGTATAGVQELHLPLYHLICRLIEKEMFG
jgi:D-sedoheptulose 7-phosphate isomerase